MRRASCSAGAAATAAAHSRSCSLVGGGDRRPRATPASKVVLATHESFLLPKKLQSAVRGRDRLRPRRSGPSGDAGALTNKLVLTKDDPIGDAAFGIDNTFASRAIDEGVVRAVRRDAARRRGQLRAPGRRRTALTPVDTGNVCVNVDDDLVRRPRHRAAADPRRPDRRRRTRTSSSPPAPRPARPAWRSCWPPSRRTATTAGSDYWTQLMANGTKLTEGWSDAYEVDFTAGRRPRRPADRAVLRLLAGVHRRRAGRHRPPARCSTPASGRSSTPACWPAPKNPDGAEALVDFMLSHEVQEALPGRDVRLPGRLRHVALPADWAAVREAA